MRCCGAENKSKQNGHRRSHVEPPIPPLGRSSRPLFESGSWRSRSDGSQAPALRPFLSGRRSCAYRALGTAPKGSAARLRALTMIIPIDQQFGQRVRIRLPSAVISPACNSERANGVRGRVLDAHEGGRRAARAEEGAAALPLPLARACRVRTRPSRRGTHRSAMSGRYTSRRSSCLNPASHQPRCTRQRSTLCDTSSRQGSWLPSCRPSRHPGRARSCRCRAWRSNR